MFSLAELQMLYEISGVFGLGFSCSRLLLRARTPADTVPGMESVMAVDTP